MKNDRPPSETHPQITPLSLLSLNIPVICAINGPVLAHAELTLVNDIVICSNTTTFTLEGRFYVMIAEGDRVAVESSGHVKFADGRVYDNFTHILFSLRDGRIAAVREYGDTEQLARVFSAVGRNG